jgi:dCMP deaminase
MAKQQELDELFLDIAERIGGMSHSRRRLVGAVIVKEGNIISFGWNGMPSGMDNNCEDKQEDGSLKTKFEVLHAESNALMKLAASGTLGAAGATLFCTTAPCRECAKLIAQAKIARIVYREEYSITDGKDLLRRLGRQVECYPASNTVNYSGDFDLLIKGNVKEITNGDD